MLWQAVDLELKKRKWTLRKLANESGINYETLRSYRYRGSEPTYTNMCKIADALHVSLDDFREGSDEDERSYRGYSKNG